jgi:Bacterial membrane flanked domain.
MTKNLKPHYLLILISTLKMIATLLVFFALAILLSPNKYYTALNLIKMLLPVVVLIYAYMFYFWHSVTMNITAEKLDFNMTAGRQNHIEILYNDIETLTLKQGFFEKMFGVSRISITIKNVEKTYGGKIMTLDQYMVFKTIKAEEISRIITENMNITLKNGPKY